MSERETEREAPPLDLAHTPGAYLYAEAWADGCCECEPPDEEMGESGTVICARCAIRSVLAECQRQRVEIERLRGALMAVLPLADVAVCMSQVSNGLRAKRQAVTDDARDVLSGRAALSGQEGA